MLEETLIRAGIAAYLDRYAVKLKKNGGSRKSAVRIQALAQDVRSGMDLASNDPIGCPVDALVQVAAAQSGYTPEQIRAVAGKRQETPLVRVRQAIALTAQERFDFSCSHIARRLGYAEHKAVAKAISQGEVFRERDPDFAALVGNLMTSTGITEKVT